MTTDRSTNNMDGTSFEKIQESYLCQHFAEYEGNWPNESARASHPKGYLDSLLAEEFTRLTCQERETSYEELHGVRHVVNETPALLSKSFREMEIELRRISGEGAYLLAEKQNVNYVTNTKFRLAFLRAENFDPTKAAHRLVAFLEGKLRYFGEALLTKRIQISDLDEDDQECLKRGQMQILPSRDRGGRAVFCFMNMIKDSGCERPVNRLKALIYTLLTLAEDEENQKRGFVTVLMQLGTVHPRDVDTEFAKENPRILKWAPVRVSAVHFCHEDPVLEFLSQVVLMGMHPESRSRHRMHKGTHTELLYSLMSFGIPVDKFPMNGESKVKTTNHSRWITRRKIKESSLDLGGEQGFFNGIDLPSRQDVLIGKGKPLQMHMGNVKLRTLVDEHVEEYNSAMWGRKAAVVIKVFDAVASVSGRFLAKDGNGWWNEVSDHDAYEKVYKLFHTIGTKMNHRKSQHSDSIDCQRSNESASHDGSASLEGISPPIFQPEKRRKMLSKEDQLQFQM